MQPRAEEREDVAVHKEGGIKCREDAANVAD